MKYIVSCIAASVYLGSNTTSEDYAAAQWDISTLFGALPLKHKSIKRGKVNGMPPEVFNKVTQVRKCDAHCVAATCFGCNRRGSHVSDFCMQDRVGLDASLAACVTKLGRWMCRHVALFSVSYQQRQS